MNHPRRTFLKSAAQLGCGLALTTMSSKLIGCGPAKNATNAAGTAGSNAGTALNNRPIGLQLYTLREDMPKDPKGVLKQIASFGYKQIEGYEGPQGLFWGMSNTDFKKYLDELGLQYVASHCNTRQNFEEKAAQAAAIGMKYLINPYLGAQKTLDDYKRAADEFNKNGEICRKAGLKFAYHNHGYSFTQLDGQFPQDVMMQNTDPNLVDYEMDIYWVVTPGQDPEAWLKKYPGRFKLGHVKDRRKGATEDDASVVIGTGSIDFSRMLKTAAASGMEYFIVEQERYDGTTPLLAAQQDAVVMKQLAF
jgi:sugar phosphate isomerase/epimerase